MSSTDLRPFYIDIDKSRDNWRYLLRGHVSGCDHGIGCQVAEFNPYFLVSRPAFAEKVVNILNDAFEEEMKKDAKT